MSVCRSEQNDKLAVILLCGLALVIIGGISWGAISSRIPSDSQTLLGVIVGGLMMFSRECLQAIRAFWLDQRTGKLTDQLASSGPANDNSSPAGTVDDPLQMEVVNPPDQPVPTTAAKPARKKP